MRDRIIPPDEKCPVLQNFQFLTALQNSTNTKFDELSSAQFRCVIEL